MGDESGNDAACDALAQDRPTPQSATVLNSCTGLHRQTREICKPSAAHSYSQQVHNFKRQFCQYHSRFQALRATTAVQAMPATGARKVLESTRQMNQALADRSEFHARSCLDIARRCKDVCTIDLSAGPSRNQYIAECSTFMARSEELRDSARDIRNSAAVAQNTENDMTDQGGWNTVNPNPTEPPRPAPSPFVPDNGRIDSAHGALMGGELGGQNLDPVSRAIGDFKRQRQYEDVRREIQQLMQQGRYDLAREEIRKLEGDDAYAWSNLGKELRSEYERRMQGEDSMDDLSSFFND